MTFHDLRPQAHIRPHCGPTNHRLRFHLGVSVPQASELVVAGEARRWREGRVLLFDDSFVHEVSNNDTAAARVVLLFDIWHPRLNVEARSAIRAHNWLLL